MTYPYTANTFWTFYRIMIFEICFNFEGNNFDKQKSLVEY